LTPVPDQRYGIRMPRRSLLADPEQAELIRRWGDELRLERLRQRIKQVDLAAVAGIAQATVSETENGRGSYESCGAMAKALDIELTPAVEAGA
jgi:DNA-binding XRE family transcriptional regulator